MTCSRCHTDWPRDRMFTRGEEKFCGLCWRVLIYPWEVGQHAKIRERITETLVERELREDPTPHPFRYQKS